MICVYLLLRCNTRHPEALECSFLVHLNTPGALLGWSPLGTGVFTAGDMQQTPTSWNFSPQLVSPLESKPEESSEAQEPDFSGLCFLFPHSPIINDSSGGRRRSIWGKVREIKNSWKRTAPPKPASKHLVSWPHLCAAHRPEALKSSPCQNMR